MKPATVKTILLGMAVMLITALIFIALPVIVPSFGTVDCDKFWCTENVVTYDTWIWDEADLPDEEAMAAYRQSIGNDTEAIPFGLRLRGVRGPVGKLHLEIDTEDGTWLIISGFLQYRVLPLLDNMEAALKAGYPLEGGLENAPVTIRVLENHENGVYKGASYELITGSNGSFSKRIEPGGYCMEISVEYEGEALYKTRPIKNYLLCSVDYNSCEMKGIEGKYPWWIWLLIGFSLIAAGYLLYRKIPRFMTGKKIPYSDIEEIVPVVKPVKKTESAGGATTRIEIIFNDTEGLVPVVRGIMENVNITVIFRDRNQNRLLSQAGVVIWGDGEGSEVDTGSEGSPQLSHEYDEKGEYRITASYKEAGMGKVISSWRTIHIVDYREEMVRLFGEMLEELNLTDREITRDMTPREVEEILAGKLEEVSRESLRNVIIGFEEANYSTHPVNRESYVRMYRAIREVRGKG
ncbi:MAG: DUF4129 domain-containing protein [Dehalococcoidales bacterium]|nr:DUF4129 domain-containing protein [Dehalococcoidales bacterium]